jgi:hypothetical protein
MTLFGGQMNGQLGFFLQRKKNAALHGT